jgi:hypothetical protein
MSAGVTASAGLPTPQDKRKDLFEGEDFDPIKYINEKFPDEGSLVNLDSVIAELREEVGHLDDEILEGIHEHAMLNSQMREEIANTKNLTSTIVQEIKSIKEKAIESESIVHEMCMDIKLLDTAKRNLTTSINTLRKFSDLMRSLDNLTQFCADRQYDEAASCLRGINDLILFFKPFESIPQIKELIEEKDQILSKAKLQIRDDFELFFKGSSSLSTDTLKNGCHLVEIIGQKFRNDILMMPAEMILEPYRKIYTKPENRTIENIEQRYAWFVRELRDFNEKYANAFPHYWGLINYIVQNFCSITRVQMVEILQSSTYSDPNDVKNLLNALRATIKFETKIAEDLLKEYQQYLNEEKDPNDEKSQYRITQLYKIKGSISSCFEMSMKPYVDTERKELESSVVSELQKDLADPMSNSLQNEDISVLNSALLMFNKVKHLLKRGSSISKSQTMYDIYKVVKGMITQYITMIIDDAYKKDKAKGKNIPFFLNSICVYINTIDHIKETLGNVSDLIVTLLEPPYTEQVDFSKEEDSCLELINELIVMVKKLIEAGLDNSFNNAFSKVNWEKLEELPHEPSRYVIEIKDNLRGILDIVKGKIGPVHYTKILNNVCQLVTQKFIGALMKLKKLTDPAVNTLLKDFNDLKMELDSLGKKSDGEPITKIYTKFVQTTSEKAVSVIRVMGMSNAQILQNIKTLQETIPAQDMEKLLSNKGFKKSEIQSILGTYEHN